MACIQAAPKEKSGSLYPTRFHEIYGRARFILQKTHRDGVREYFTFLNTKVSQDFLSRAEVMISFG